MGIGTIDGKAPLQQELVTEEYYNQSKQGLPYYDVDFLGGFNDVFSDHTITPSYYIDFKPYNHADFGVTYQEIVCPQESITEISLHSSNAV